MASNKYIDNATDEAKDMLDFLLKYVDSHMVEVFGNNNQFLAYCEDKERGDIIFSINAVRVREKDDSNNEDTVVDTTNKGGQSNE